MKTGKNIEKIIRELDLGLDVNSKVDQTVLSEILTAHKKIRSTQLFTNQSNIWRIIMNSVKVRKVKVVIAMVAVMVLLGFVPFNGATAFGKITHEIATTLDRLRAMVLGEDPPEGEYVEGQIDESVKICTTSRVYLSSEISSLEAFLNDRDIYFTSAGSGSGKYAVIAADEFADLRKFLRSSSIEVVSCLTVLTYAGQRAMVAARDTRNGSVGLAVTTREDGGEHLSLDFAFHNVEDGCEVNGIKLATGEALLISGIKSIDEESSDKGISTILVLPEVK